MSSLDLFSNILASSIINYSKSKVEEILINFTKITSNKCNIERYILITLWNKISLDYQINYKILLEKEKIINNKITKQEIIDSDNYIEKKINCCYIFTSKSKKKKCNKKCKGNSSYCSKHEKIINSRHFCCFTDNKNGVIVTECGARITKNIIKYQKNSNYKNINYFDKWLCKKHIKQIDRFLLRQQTRCNWIYGYRSNKEGEQCSSQSIKDSNCCRKHTSKNKTNKNDSEDELSNINKKGNCVINKNLNFNIKIYNQISKAKKHPKWIAKMIKGEDEDYYIFIDIYSGLVCSNNDDPLNEIINIKKVKILGVWNDEKQNILPLTKVAETYAKKLNITFFKNENKEILV
jgi:hypothetical protein